MGIFIPVIAYFFMKWKDIELSSPEGLVVMVLVFCTAYTTAHHSRPKSRSRFLD